MSGTSSTTPPLDGVDTSLTPEQRKAYEEIGAAMGPLVRKSTLHLAQAMEHEAFVAGFNLHMKHPKLDAAIAAYLAASGAEKEQPK